MGVVTYKMASSAHKTRPTYNCKNSTLSKKCHMSCRLRTKIDCKMSLAKTRRRTKIDCKNSIAKTRRWTMIDCKNSTRTKIDCKNSIANEIDCKNSLTNLRIDAIAVDRFLSTKNFHRKVPLLSSIDGWNCQPHYVPRPRNYRARECLAGICKRRIHEWLTTMHEY